MLRTANTLNFSFCSPVYMPWESVAKSSDAAGLEVMVDHERDKPSTQDLSMQCMS